MLLAGLLLAPSRAWGNLLLAAFCLLSLGLFGPVLVSLLYVTDARWATVFRRVAEAMAGLLVPGALLLAAALAGSSLLYEWTHGGAAAKQGWLRLPFFLLRALLYVVLWIGLARMIISTSRRQDATGDPALSRRNVRTGALFLVLFGISYSAASFDWIMSLEPHWFSTMFGVYAFAGMFLGGLAALVLTIRLLQRRGHLAGFTADHLHDLGKLVFAFSSFWAYIWFCQ